MKGTRRRDYLNDYKRSAEGDYVYTGDLYRFTGDVRRMRVLTAALALASLAATLGSGLINAAGMSNTFYVILPYIAEVGGMFFLCWNAVRLLRAGPVLKAYVYLAVSKRLPNAGLAICVSALVGLLGSVVFLILNGTGGKPVQSVLYPITKAASAAVGLLARRVTRAFTWEKQPH